MAHSAPASCLCTGSGQRTSSTSQAAFSHARQWGTNHLVCAGALARLHTCHHRPIPWPVGDLPCHGVRFFSHTPSIARQRKTLYSLGRGLVDVEPLLYQDTVVKLCDVVPNHNIDRMLCLLVILLLTPEKDIPNTTQKCKKMLGVIRPQGGVVVEKPTNTYGCTKCHIVTTLVRDFDRWPLLLLFFRSNPASSTKLCSCGLYTLDWFSLWHCLEGLC